MTAIPHRGKYQGVLQIVRFNRPKYLAAAGCLAAAAGTWPLLPAPARAIAIAAALPALCWTISSLLVSHYVYDRAQVYDMSRLARALRRAPRRWLSIHCGFDETTPLLAAEFPAASGEAVDIFDSRAMSESSIREARHAGRNTTIRAASARFDALPFAAGAFDAVFCIFAAHELRRHADRVRLFTEIARILNPAGEFVLVEHLRDWPNFLAFGPGFLHFHSWRAWQRAACAAGLALRTHFTSTAFVRAAIFGRAL